MLKCKKCGSTNIKVDYTNYAPIKVFGYCCQECGDYVLNYDNDYINYGINIQKNSNNMLKCKKCDSANVRVDFGKVCTSIPAKYGYKCQDCGDVGYVNCDEVNRHDFNGDGYQIHPRSNNEDLLKHIGTPKENDNTFGLTGWICPKCGRCYSPFTSMCSFCGGNNWGTITCTDGTGSNINL